MLICHSCCHEHPAPLCKRDWEAPCVRCGGKRGPGSEAGENVCFKCFFASLVPDGSFEGVMASVRVQARMQDYLTMQGAAQ
jgi:hypothetical protein